MMPDAILGTILDAKGERSLSLSPYFEREREFLYVTAIRSDFRRGARRTRLKKKRNICDDDACKYFQNKKKTNLGSDFFCPTNTGEQLNFVCPAEPSSSPAAQTRLII